MRVRVPLIASVETAVRIYNQCPYLGNQEIKVLFGGIGDGRCGKLKQLALVEMEKRGMMRYNPYVVNTDAAYAAWGLDIADLERRFRRLEKLGMLAEGRPAEG